jgi:hypothetical protein
MNQIANERLNSATPPDQPAEVVTSETSVSANQEPLQLCQAHPIANLAIALGKTIEARASEVLAIDASQVGAATIVTETEACVARINRDLEALWAKMRSERKSHSEQEVARIAEICKLLRKPFPDEKWFCRTGLSLDRQIPIDLMASDLAALAATACDWAVSVATVGKVSSALEQRLGVVLSIEKFIIELGNSLIEEARVLTRLRNPSSRDDAICRIKRLIEGIREAGLSLAKEALTAASFTATSSPASIPQGNPKVWSRLPVYHGTSATRLTRIVEDGCLRATDREDPDNPTVSLTLDRNVAEYFACQAALRASEAQLEADSNAVVLELDGHALAALFHELRAGEVSWQRELVCCDSIEQLDRVLIGSEPVPPERFADYRQLGRKAFMPTSEFDPSWALWLSHTILHDQAKSAPKWWH